MASPRAHARDHEAACALSLRPRRAREHEEEAAKASASLAGSGRTLAGSGRTEPNLPNTSSPPQTRTDPICYTNYRQHASRRP